MKFYANFVSLFIRKNFNEILKKSNFADNVTLPVATPVYKKNNHNYKEHDRPLFC